MKKNRHMTRRKRLAIRRRMVRAEIRSEPVIQELLRCFEVQTGYMMHNVFREYRDSSAAKEIVRFGKVAMSHVAKRLSGIYAAQPRGTTGSPDEYWNRFITWTLLASDILKITGRTSPYSSKTPYINQDMRIYVQACVDCMERKPQAVQIHLPDYVPAAEAQCAVA